MPMQYFLRCNLFTYDVLKMLSVDTFLQDQQARGGSQTACGGRLDRVGRSDRLDGAVRPVCRDQPAVDLRTSTREGPVRVDARRVALG
jgi:hypothetical protein